MKKPVFALANSGPVSASCTHRLAVDRKFSTQRTRWAGARRRTTTLCTQYSFARFEIGHTPRKNRLQKPQPPASSHIVQSALPRFLGIFCPRPELAHHLLYSIMLKKSMIFLHFFQLFLLFFRATRYCVWRKNRVQNEGTKRVRNEELGVIDRFVRDGRGGNLPPVVYCALRLPHPSRLRRATEGLTSLCVKKVVHPVCCSAPACHVRRIKSHAPPAGVATAK